MKIEGFVPVFLYGTEKLYFSRTRKKKNFLDKIGDLTIGDLYPTKKEAIPNKKHYLFKFMGIAKIIIKISL